MACNSLSPAEGREDCRYRLIRPWLRVYLDPTICSRTVVWGEQPKKETSLSFLAKLVHRVPISSHADMMKAPS